MSPSKYEQGSSRLSKLSGFLAVDCSAAFDVQERASGCFDDETGVGSQARAGLTGEGAAGEGQIWMDERFWQASRPPAR